MPFYSFTSSRNKPANNYSLFFRASTNDNTNLVTEGFNNTELALRNTNLCINTPSFLRRLNITGAIAISRSLQGHPSTTAIFYGCKADECEIRLGLQNGKKVNLFGLAFRITSLNIVPSETDSDQIKIQLQLSGVHDSYGNPSRNPLDLPVRLKGDNCDNWGWISLSKLARGTGAKYSGKPIHIYVARNTSALATTTVRQLLSRAIVNGQFIYYSHPDRVEGRDWGKTTRHIFNMDSYYAIQSHRFAGAGYLMPEYKVQLAKEYRNTEINLANIQEIEEEEKPEITIRWEFENAKSLVDCQTPAQPLSVGEEIYILKNPTADILKDPGIAFDVGGFTKTAHKIYEEKGLEVLRITKTWGYINSSLETYTAISKDAEISGDENYSSSVFLSDNFRVIFTPFRFYISVSSAWKEVISTKTTRKYDSEGYLIAEITTGKKLSRLKQDDSGLAGIRTLVEALELELQAETAVPKEQAPLKNRAIALRNLADAYRFTETEPINKAASYELHPFSRYYSDIVKPWDKCDWIEPRFAHHTLIVENRRITKENPGSTEEFPLRPITQGKEFREEVKVTVTSKKKPERFVTTNFFSNAEGEDLEQKLKIGGSREGIGRPSIQQRKEIIEPLPNGASAGGSSFLGQKKPTEENKKYKYLLNSLGSDARGNIPTGSISFPDVYDPGLARKAAEIQLSIDNTKQAEVLIIRTLYNPAYDEGDIFVFDGLDYVILGISYTIEIESGIGNFKCDDFTLTLGRLIEPSVTLRRIKNTSGSRLRTGVLNGLYAIDGNVTQLKSIYNHLSPGAIASAIELGLLDEYLDRSGLRVTGQEDFENRDGIDNFLNNSLTGSSSEGSGGLGDLGFAGSLAPEGGTTVDLRSKTPLDELTDLIMRAALANDFNSQLEKLLGKELLDGASGRSSDSSSSGSGGGGGSELQKGGSLFPGLTPNIILEGGDGFLQNLLNDLFKTLDLMLYMLSQKKVAESGGGGGASSGAGAGGGGGGAPGGGGFKPVIIVGDLTITLPSFDISGLIAMLLEMIQDAIALAKNFDLTLEELLASLLEAQAGRQGGSSGSGNGSESGSGSGSGGGGSGREEQIRYIYPEGVDPATIRIIAPENETFDLTELLDGLDELLLVLDELANREFGFDLPLELFQEQEQLIEERNSPTGNLTSSVNGLTGGTGSSASSGATIGGTTIIEMIVEVVDVSGVIGGGVAPLPERANFGSAFGSASGTSGGASGSLTNDNPGSLASSGSATASSGLSGDADYSGNTGEFNFDGWDSEGEGFGENATPFDGTEFSIEPVIPVDPGFYLPTTTVDIVIEYPLGEFVTTPEDFSFTPLYEGNTLLVLGATASNLIEWSIVGNSEGVKILTPFDLEPTIEFDDNFSGDFLILKLSLRGAPDIYQILTINITPTSTINVSGYGTIAKVLVFEGAKVDTQSLVAVPNFIEDGVSQNTSNLYRWQEP